MAQHNVVAHVRTAQIKVTIFETKRFVYLYIVTDWKWRRSRGIENLNLVSRYLDGSCAQIRILCAWQTVDDISLNLDDIL
jgi:hypothetical protein